MAPRSSRDRGSHSRCSGVDPRHGPEPAYAVTVDGQGEVRRRNEPNDQDVGLSSGDLVPSLWQRPDSSYPLVPGTCGASTPADVRTACSVGNPGIVAATGPGSTERTMPLAAS